MENRIIRFWQTPPPILSIEQNQVHVWRISFEIHKHDLSMFFNLLSEEESNRANKIVFSADRIRYTLSRASLRMILGNYLQLDPAGIEFSVDQFGKPFLSQINSEKKLDFNVSHAGDFGLIAVGRRRRVGVDLEPVRQDSSLETIARRFFTPEETRQLLSIPVDLQPGAFFTCWTRKEAFVKAVGEGLSIPLDQFEVTFTPNESPRIVQINNLPGEAEQWSVYQLELSTGYVGALVAEGENLEVSGWDWSKASNWKV